MEDLPVWYNKVVFIMGDEEDIRILNGVPGLPLEVAITKTRCAEDCGLEVGTHPTGAGVVACRGLFDVEGLCYNPKAVHEVYETMHTNETDDDSLHTEGELD